MLGEVSEDRPLSDRDSSDKEKTVKLLMVDENGDIVQEYGDVTAQLDGMDIQSEAGSGAENVLKVVIPGEMDDARFGDDDLERDDHA